MGSEAQFFPWQEFIKEHSERPFLIDETATISYAEFDRRVCHIMEALDALKQPQKARIALAAENQLDYIVLLWAIWQKGLLALPLNTRLPAKEILANMERVQCDILITDNPHNFKSNKAVYAFVDFLRYSGHVESQGNDLPLAQLASIVFTSGSSGQAKAAVHSLGNHYYSALGANMNMPLDSRDRWLLTLPLYHVGGLATIFRTMLAGSALVFPKASLDLAGNIRQFGISHVSMVATQLHRCLRQPDGERILGGMKAILLGGSAIPDALIHQSVAAKLPIHTSYGSTESASQAAATAPGADMSELRTAGRPLPYRELRIDGGGQICLRGHTLFKGYWQENRIVDARDESGWFATGDSGFLDDTGNLVVTGRIDNMFISGGENIQPAEIERALCRLEKVATALVLPVDDEEFGQRPLAFVRLDNNALPESEALRKALREVLPGYKIPLAILPWPEERETGSIKVDRLYFRQLAAAWSAKA